MPVLPDLSRQLGASPTMIGLLFASFGVTLLTVSIPMGAISDRIGRKGPMVGGLVALAAATLLFAFADSLPWLFAARLVQGAADAVTWVVGFALIADLYDADERGRVSGIVMSGTSFAVMVGPTLGGWLYELGGIRLPFIAVAGAGARRRRAVPLARRSVAVTRPPSPCRSAWSCACRRSPPARSSVVAISATISMLEPVLALYLDATSASSPARLGLIFGAAAVVTDDRCTRSSGGSPIGWGARRMTMLGLLLMACMIAAARPGVELSVGARCSSCSRRRRRVGDHAVAGLHGRSDAERRRRDRSASATASTTSPGAPACSAARRSAGFCSNAWALRGSRCCGRRDRC